MRFKSSLAASAQILTAPAVELMTTILAVFACVSPASVYTAQSVQLWCTVRIVKKCTVWVAHRLRNVILLNAGEPFVLLTVIRPTDAINVTEAGVSNVTVAAWIALGVGIDTARNAL